MEFILPSGTPGGITEIVDKLMDLFVQRLNVCSPINWSKTDNWLIPTT